MIGKNDDNGCGSFLFDDFENVDSVLSPGQLNVQRDDVGMEMAKAIEGILGATGLPDHVEAPYFIEGTYQTFTQRHGIVHDQQFHGAATLRENRVFWVAP